MSDERSRRGRLGEHLAVAFLQLQGYDVLARNARRADVEIDILARRERLLAVVEVKLRGPGWVPARDAVRAAQRRRLRRAAQALLAEQPWADAVRIDVVAIDWRDSKLHLQHERGVG